MAVKEDLLKKKMRNIVPKLKNAYGMRLSFLDHTNAFELLCAVCLSAQCTDERVNMVTPALFAEYPDPESMSQAPLKHMEKLVKSTGFYKNKAKNLISMAEDLVEKHGSEVPNTMEELHALAGVGRKTANVVLGQWFGKSEGVVVDTHVKRIANLLGLTKNQDPVKIEKDLSLIVPKKYWDVFSLWLISHGRAVCVARRPNCKECFMKRQCEWFSTNK